MIEKLFSGAVRVDASHGPDAAMWSLTDMWKASGGESSKQPAMWLRNGETQALIEAFRSQTAKSQFGSEEPVRTLRGGTTPGTWAVTDLAIAYAQFLSPEFHLRTIQEWREWRLKTRTEGSAMSSAVVMRLLDVMVETQRQQSVILERLTALELHPTAAVGHTITPAEAASIRIRKAQIARLMVELGEVPKARAAHAIIWEGIQRAAEWYGKCATIDTMPPQNYAEVDRYLRERRTELERRREAAKPRQLDIFRKPALVRLPPAHAGSDSAVREEGPA
jgi:hypothetical protein